MSSPAKDTPRTNARKWLSGQAKTPDAKKQLFRDWKNASVLTRPSNAAAGGHEGVVWPDKKLFQAPVQTQAQAGPSKTKTRSTATSGATGPASIFFNPTQQQQQQQQRRPFEAERKRPTSPGPGSDTDRAESNEGPSTKRPKLNKAAAAKSTTTTTKGKSKPTNKSSRQTQSDVTMADAREPPEDGEDGGDDEEVGTSRRLADGSVMMSFRDAGGNVQEMRVRDYLTSRRASSPEDYDLDYDYDYHYHNQQERERATSSSATSSIETEPTTDMPAHLVSLLSLNGSPNKKHRREVARTKEQLYKRVLQEPSLQAPAASGLLELAQEHDGESESTAGGWTGGGGGDGDDEAEGPEGSGEDDDWESEPEGWKELGGEDLMGLDDDL